ncbi:hypothetical protein FA13DRAFT_1457128 [Coprinellus micaceus]|uniref:Uncharacterized protein n=1 Tax=Coprinellus micaceus TaxID=71717 RepID=A0A4Y7SNA6_COPMI|nr:hypothetical protein FA13DRAFT_1457128 [Coprinellus micaceus]
MDACHLSAQRQHHNSQTFHHVQTASSVLVLLIGITVISMTLILLPRDLFIELVDELQPFDVLRIDR